MSRDDRGRQRSLISWLAGLAVVSALVWLLFPYFETSICVVDLDPALGINLPKPGQSLHWRREGWGTTNWGLHGVAGGVPDVTRLEGLKVLLWGDSMVQALQVDDQWKTAQQITRIWQDRHDPGLTGVSVGGSGRSAADYHFLLPRYEEVVEGLSAHFIIVAALSDFSPEGEFFLAPPAFRFTGLHREPITSSKVRLAARWRLNFLIRRYFEVKEAFSTRGLRFGLGRAEAGRPDPEPAAKDEAPPIAAWSFALKALKDRAERPLVIVYAPGLPTLKGGRLVRGEEVRPLVDLFAAQCRQADLGFLDLAPVFVRSFEETGLFPCGFNNGRPGAGHFNAHGQRLIAEAICDYIETHFNALHSG
ncbi:MAG: hypothetical protein JRC92_10170 [Deltaproteobacteria bacterium]|nr:hypothetical protein [Deltaproteobacteria bacterium]